MTSGRAAVAEREASTMAHVRERLIAVYGPPAAAEVVAAMNRETARFAGAPIRDYVPLLVERFTRDDLRHRDGSP